MKQIKLNLFTGFFALASAVDLYGQGPTGIKDTLSISLPGVWLKAVEHSRDIELKRLSTQISHEALNDLRMERLPEWDVKGSAEKASNMPIYDNGLFAKPSQHEIIHTLYKLGTDFYLNLYNGNKLNLKIEEEKTLHKIAEIQEEETVSNIKYQSAVLYLELQKSVIFRGLIIRDIADQEKQLLEIEAFHKNGTVLKSDILRVQLDLSKRKMALVQIENDILIASQKLGIIIGEPDELLLQPEAINISSLHPGTYEDCLDAALKHSFPYQVSSQRIGLSAIDLRSVKANLRPKFGMYGEYYYANPQIFLFPYNPAWYSLGVVGVKASFPVSALYHNIYKVKVAALEYEKEKVAHKDMEDKVRQQVKEAYLRYEEALVEIEVAETSKRQAEENARIIKNTYFNQASLITDLLDADIQVLQTRFELAAARIMAQNKYYLLQNIIGVL